MKVYVYIYVHTTEFIYMYLGIRIYALIWDFQMKKLDLSKKASIIT
jgi:hypothetical protein